MASNDFASFTVRLPVKTYDDLTKLADREFSSLNREVNIAVRAHLDADRNRNKGKGKP